MISAQPVKNRIVNLSQNVADLLHNPKCFSTCSSHRRQIFSGNLFDCTPDKPIQYEHPAIFNPCKPCVPNQGIMPIGCEPPFPCQESNPCQCQNETIESIPCEHSLPVTEALNPCLLNNGIVNPISGGHPGEINQPVIPCFPNIPAQHPVQDTQTGSFNNLGYFVNLGTFINAESPEQFQQHDCFHEPCDHPIVNPLSESACPIPSCQPVFPNGFSQPESFQHCLPDCEGFNNLCRHLNCFPHPPPHCHEKCYRRECLPCWKKRLLTEVELVKGSVRALPLRFYRKKEILEVLDKAEKIICDARCPSAELVNTILTLLQLASAKITLFTERSCSSSKIFSTVCTSKNFYSTRECSFR